MSGEDLLMQQPQRRTWIGAEFVNHSCRNDHVGIGNDLDGADDRAANNACANCAAHHSVHRATLYRLPRRHDHPFRRHQPGRDQR